MIFLFLIIGIISGYLVCLVRKIEKADIEIFNLKEDK